MTNVNPKFVVLRDRYSPDMLFTPTVRIARKYVEGKFSEEMFQDLQDGLVMDTLGSRVAARKVEFLSVKTAGMRQSYKTALEHLKQLENSGTFTLGPRPDSGASSRLTHICVRSLRCTPIHPSRQDHADGLVPWPGIHPYPRKGGAPRAEPPGHGPLPSASWSCDRRLRRCRFRERTIRGAARPGFSLCSGPIKGADVSGRRR